MSWAAAIAIGPDEPQWHRGRRSQYLHEVRSASVEQSSTTIISTGGVVWAKIDASASPNEGGAIKSGNYHVTGNMIISARCCGLITSLSFTV